MRPLYFVVRLAVIATAVVMWHPPLQAQMVWNHAVAFDGSGYIAIPPSPSLQFNGSFSVEAWVNTTSSGAVTVVGNNGFRLLVDNGLGRLQIGNNTRLMGKTRINNGNWNHIAAIFDQVGHTITFYVNGVIDTSSSDAATMTYGTDSMTVGKSVYGSGAAKLDEVRIWKTALSGASITARYHTSLAVGTGLFSNLVLSLTFQNLNHSEYAIDASDKSVHGNNGIVLGAKDVDMTDAPEVYLTPNQALNLDGADGWAVANNNPNLPALGPFTLEAWIYPMNTLTGKQQSIISRETSGFSGYEMYLMYNGRLGITTMGAYGSTSSIIPSNKWTHVAVTYSYDGMYATTRLYVNGVPDGAFNAAPITAFADSLCIGRSAGQTNYFWGYIDEVRMSGYEKTADQIRRGMFTSEDYYNRRSASSIELVYSFDGSVFPTTYQTPALTLRGNADFSYPGFGTDVPVSPLTRDPAYVPAGPFPDGYYLKSASKRIPSSGTNSGSIEDTLAVGESVTISSLKVFLGWDHTNEGALQVTLISPSGDSARLWNLDYQSQYTSGVATIFDDGADSSMSHGDWSFTPTIRPHEPLTAVFGGKNSAGLWRLRMSQLVAGFSGYLYGWGIGFNNQTLAGVNEAAAALPSAYALTQNYPNPFNPTTTIRYQVAARSHVTIEVFNTIGQHVATLVDGDVEAGDHQVTFNAGQLASGVYFYRMRSADFMQTRKLLLLR